MKRTIQFLLVLLSFPMFAQGPAPELSVWKMADGTTGKYYNLAGDIIDTGIEADVQSVHYDCDSVYISASGIPSYLTGPFLDGNPGVPDNQNWLFRISRNPVQELGEQTEVPLGAIGVLINGTLFENYSDAMSWMNAGVWWRNANVWELDGFDCARGHPQGTAYHHHQNPVPFDNVNNPESDICDQFPSEGLYTVDPTVHSPLIGFAFDGFPLYGPYGYVSPMDPSSGVHRIKSSYGLRDITERTTLADGTSVSPGPSLENFALGAFREDFEFKGNGDVDEHNGRFCVTPEYPCGIYAYFATQDSNGYAAYPFFIGPTYYGVTDECNFTIGSGGGGGGGPGGGPGGGGPGGGPGGGGMGGANVSCDAEISLPEDALPFNGSCNLLWSFNPQDITCIGGQFVINIETNNTLESACHLSLDNISGNTIFASVTSAGETISLKISDGNCCSEIIEITLPSTECANLDCEGVEDGSSVPGSPCDDGDLETENDVYQDDCTCSGTAIVPPDCEGVIGGPAVPGSDCDDGDENTFGDEYQDDCTCEGESNIQEEDCEGDLGGPAIPGTPCDDENPETSNDIWQFDCTCLGSIFDCTFLNLNIGDPCNDFNALTIDDTVMENCVCLGTPIDCEGTVEGPNGPGTPCDDGDPNTTGDAWDDECICNGFSVGIEDVLSDLVLYPNPVADYLQVKTETQFDSFILTNINGQQVLSRFTYGEVNIEIDMTNLSSGIYFLSIFKNGDFLTQKILKD